MGIPQLILAGASVDDVFVIVIFTALTSLAGGNKISPLSFVNIPVSLILGVITGSAVGFILTKLFQIIHMRGTFKAMIFLSAAFLLCAAEDALTSIKFPVTFSSLIAVMLTGITIKKFDQTASEGLASKFNKLWICAEVFLFVLVGAAVDISYIGKVRIAVVILIFRALCFRMIGVFVCLIKTKLSSKERLFCMLAYTPKATVQAAISGVSLDMGLSCGNIVLTVAVLAIVITAPLGAFAIDMTYKKLLDHNEKNE